jgi:GT2 family glycosyltransferase
MELVSIIIPSTGRKDRLVDCLKGLIRTTEGLNTEIICVIDNDPESLAAANKTLKGPNTESITPKSTGAILPLGIRDSPIQRGLYCVRCR